MSVISGVDPLLKSLSGEITNNVPLVESYDLVTYLVL